MTGMTFEGLVLIALCVFLGWVASVYLIDRILRAGKVTFYGTTGRLMVLRVLIWTGAISASVASLILASLVLPTITVLAILFGLQAMLLDYCSRIRFLRIPSPQSVRSRVSST